MIMCKTCGGAIFAANEVTGYGGPTCSGYQHPHASNPITQPPMSSTKDPKKCPTCGYQKGDIDVCSDSFHLDTPQATKNERECWMCGAPVKPFESVMMCTNLFCCNWRKPTYFDTVEATKPVDEQINLLEQLFEVGKELSAMYAKYSGDLDFTDWLKETLPKTAINGENGVLNILNDYISNQVASAVKEAEQRGYERAVEEYEMHKAGQSLPKRSN